MPSRDLLRLCDARIAKPRQHHSGAEMRMEITFAMLVGCIINSTELTDPSACAKQSLSAESDSWAQARLRTSFRLNNRSRRHCRTASPCLMPSVQMPRRLYVLSANERRPWCSWKWARHDGRVLRACRRRALVMRQWNGRMPHRTRSLCPPIRPGRSRQ